MVEVVTKYSEEFEKAKEWILNEIADMQKLIMSQTKYTEQEKARIMVEDPTIKHLTNELIKLYETSVPCYIVKGLEGGK